MKVKISYTVDLETVPNEVFDMLQKQNKNEIIIIYDEIVSNIESNNIEKSIDTIHQLRLKLANLDLKLNDAQNILDSYMKIRYSNTDESDSNEQEL